MGWLHNRRIGILNNLSSSSRVEHDSVSVRLKVPSGGYLGRNEFHLLAHDSAHQFSLLKLTAGFSVDLKLAADHRSSFSHLEAGTPKRHTSYLDLITKTIVN